MARLTGFRAALQPEIEKAKAANDLSVSPFQDGVKFTITDYTFEVPTYDVPTDDKPKPFAVFVTSLGSLAVKSLARPRVNSDGQSIDPTGELNLLIREIFADITLKSNGEKLQALVNKCKDKPLIVRLEKYVYETSYGKLATSYIRNIDFVK